MTEKSPANASTVAVVLAAAPLCALVPCLVIADPVHNSKEYPLKRRPAIGFWPQFGRDF